MTRLLTVRGAARLFSTVAARFHAQQLCAAGPGVLPSPARVCPLSYGRRPGGCAVLSVVFMCVSLMAVSLEHLCVYLLAVCVFSLKKCLFKSSTPSL